ncbi:MAG: MFS transporter [Nitrososphaerota archaeon]|nr:MFS transporter [Aigarchaeota archaeon]MDW8077142.1 MFS transporter [Nitrososphaerota archaeon]
MDEEPKKRIVLLVTALGSFLTPFIGSSINVALPSMAKEFTMDVILMSWVAMSFLLATAAFLVPFGRVADLYGRKKIFTYGLIIYTVFSFLSATSTSPILIILYRAFQGVGGAMIFATAAAILTSAFPVGERGKALGINAASIYLGLSLGPSLGGLMTQNLGWRSLFILNTIIGLIVILIVFWKLDSEWAEAKGERFDLTGSIAYGLALIALMYGISLLPYELGLLFITLGVLGLVAFVILESKTESPVLNINLFRKNVTFTFSNLAALINYSATFAVGYLLSIYLQNVKGLTPQDAGMLLLIQPAMMAVFSPVAGRLSDKIEPRVLASIGMALTAASLFIFTSLSEQTEISFIAVNLLLIGLGFGLFSSPNTNAVMSSVDKRLYGIASATLATMRSVGQMLSMGIVTVIFAIYMGRVQITPESYSILMKSMDLAFIVFSVLCFIGIFASLARGKLRT